MALFNKDKEQETGAQGAHNNEQDYFAGMEGLGLEGFTAETLSTAYLSMVQPGSSAEANHPPGTWRNTATDENFSDTVEVVVLAFQTVWTERDKNPPYMTVGRYVPNSVRVDIEYPKPGTRGFPKMTNPESKNKVEELFIYACTLKNNPEAGLLYFSPTIGSMSTCKAWNAQMRSARGANGKVAPIFGFSWHLNLALVPNPATPQNPNNKIAKLVKVTRGADLTVGHKDFYIGSIQPLQLAASDKQAVMMLAAPEHSGDVS